ncbi:arginyltransferase [Camelimonas abortus]|uniref:Aspartate/glutamate leucyltransferase n=1 Tax=Camelimonas abortus TaxID=1017184 RepID=A0ABV7LDD2_9HYPH
MTTFSRETPRFFITAPSPCPYLPGREERKVFTHLIGRRAREINDLLSNSGFRRSQTIAYRPACEGCQACVSVRIPVAGFRPGRAFRRVLAANGDLAGVMGPAEATSEQYALFREYLLARHADGGMADMTVQDYVMMVEETHVDTRLVTYRRRGPDTAFTGRGEGPLVAAALTDILHDGLSMVYSFYDPAQPGRSLGTFMILDHIRRARVMGLPYVYLGYWVEGSARMAYKARFRPQERLTPAGWRRAE